ncbi:MAG: glucosamine-6-phosphate isomerase [Terriglobia bacterium]
MTLEEILTLPADDVIQRAKMGVRLFPDIPSMIEYFARSMADEIRANDAQHMPTRWILPVGPVAQYFRLVEICNHEHISWREVYTFQMDEFLDWEGRLLPLDHPMSFQGFMRRQVFDKLDGDLRPNPAHVHFPDPFDPDEIGRQISAAGGVDTCFGGIGYHGHVAFNEPPISRWHRISVEQLRQSRTRVVILGDDSIVVQSIGSAGGSSGLIPPMAVTMGMREILRSRRIRLFLAGGERHRAVFRISLLAEPTTDYPSTLLQGHPDAIIHTDQATARPILPSLF